MIRSPRPADPGLAVETAALTKRYGARVVLDHLDLHVPRGSLFGFLGPNGAGKTTTIRILLGLLRADGGEARILGHGAWRHGPRVRADVGYLPGDVRFYDGLTGRQTLRFLDAARGGGAQREIERLARRLDLELDKRVRNYSRGMKQKLGLIQALMHRPQLLILDEPTIALDPLVRKTLYDELRAAAADGRTVLFSSHTLSEVEELCDQVAILRDGRLIECDRIETLRARAVRHVEVGFDGTAPASDPPDGLRVAQRDAGRWVGTWSGPPEELIAWLNRERVSDLRVAPPDLEDLFLAYYDRAGDGQ